MMSPQAGAGPRSRRVPFIVANWKMHMTRGPADVLAYMPAVAWRSGTGMVAWTEIDDGAPARGR